MKTYIKQEQWGVIICWPSKPQSKQKWREACCGWEQGMRRFCRPGGQQKLPCLHFPKEKVALLNYQSVKNVCYVPLESREPHKI